MRKEIIILAAVILVAIVAFVLGSNYYRSSIQNKPVATNSNSNKATVNTEALVRPDSPTLGPADAKVTLVEFYDPECEACAAFGPIVKKILNENEGKARLVMRYLPLHPNSMKAAIFTEVAGEQGKYWQAQELLFQKQSEWGQKHGQPAAAPSDIDALFEKYGMALGMDLQKMKTAMTQNQYSAKIERDKKDAQDLGIRQTPTFFVNGRPLARFGEPELRSLIAEEMAK